MTQGGAKNRSHYQEIHQVALYRSSDPFGIKMRLFKGVHGVQKLGLYGIHVEGCQPLKYFQ